MTWEDAKTQEWNRVTQERALEHTQMRQLVHRTREHIHNLANTADYVIVISVIPLYANRSSTCMSVAMWCPSACPMWPPKCTPQSYSTLA